MKTFALKGNVIYTKWNTEFTTMKNGYIVCEAERSLMFLLNFQKSTIMLRYTIMAIT